MLGNTSSTIHFNRLIMALLKGEDYQPELNTTLNEKFSILTDSILPDGTYPKLKYFAIGNGGIKSAYDANRSSEYPAYSAALFNQIPFVVVPAESDLTLSERMKYRFKKELVIDNVVYYEYYLKVIDDVTSPSATFTVEINDDQSILNEINYGDLNALNPQPRDKKLLSDETNKYITNVSKLTFSMSLSEMEQFKEGMIIKYGEDVKLDITELAICSGHDIPHDNDLPESVWTQVMFNVPIDEDVKQMISKDKNGIVKLIDVGSMQSIFF